MRIFEENMIVKYKKYERKIKGNNWKGKGPENKIWKAYIYIYIYIYNIYIYIERERERERERMQKKSEEIEEL